MSGDAVVAQAILDRIASEIRPRLSQDKLHGGYDCCGCSSYRNIVEDIESIVRDAANNANGALAATRATRA